MKKQDAYAIGAICTEALAVTMIHLRSVYTKTTGPCGIVAAVMDFMSRQAEWLT